MTPPGSTLKYAAAKALTAAGFKVAARDEAQDYIGRKAVADAQPDGASAAPLEFARIARTEQEEADRVIATAINRMLKEPAFRM